ncbi:MAG TPA: hypothetical protein PKM65_03240 [Spirochaetota bacterium]|nr:hypothetical protein [Spirochaetota bacterium]HNT10902.1 hypothetical protein [Spirochaetota bacterium]
MGPLTLVYLRDGRMILTAEPFADWREAQDRYADYMSSLAFETIEAVRRYLVLEYRITEERAAVITAGWQSGEVEVEV